MSEFDKGYLLGMGEAMVSKKKEARAEEKENKEGTMNPIRVAIVALIGITVGAVLVKFIWKDIKDDPVGNLIVPAATALLTNLLLWWLEMQR